MKQKALINLKKNLLNSKFNKLGKKMVVLGLIVLNCLKYFLQLIMSAS